MKKFDPYLRGQEIINFLKGIEAPHLNQEVVCQKLKITPTDLTDLRGRHQIVFWTEENGEYTYPSWQFNDEGLFLDGIQDILQVFCVDDTWRIVSYFLMPRFQLQDHTPLSLLRGKENRAEVIAHAKRHCEENTW